MLDLFWTKLHMSFSKGRKPSISYFPQFGCTCYILNNKVYLKIFDVKAQKSIFLSYYEFSKAYKVYNSVTKMVKESIDNKFDDKECDTKMSELVECFWEIHVSEDTSEAGG